MSKSIKQYKNAMDNIKISDSFMKRTETLLNELPEQQVNISLKSNPYHTVSKISAAGLGLAACFIAVIAVKSSLAQNNAITTDTTEETVFVTEVTSVSETTEEVYLNIEESNAYDMEESIGSGNNTEQSAVTSAPKPVQTTVQSSAKNETANDEQLTAGNAEAVGLTVNKAEAAITEAPPEAKLLYDINFNNADIEIQSYISSASTTEPKLILEASEAQNLITTIGTIIYDSKSSSTYSKFVSEFVITVTDKTTGEAAFNIYLTNSQSVVVTAHLKNSQSRMSYLLSPTDYSELEHYMFLYFGSESDYEAYSALKSGK